MPNDKPDRPSTPITALRNVAGIASAVPAAAGGVAAGLFTLNRRVGVDFFVERWLDSLFWSTGVTIDVQGADNLEAARPAVFLFNHRNNFDVLMAAKLVRRQFTAIGKKEAADNPIGAALGKMIDAVFIDRSDTAGAIEALQPVNDAMSRGLSLIVSPEGTRSETGELLPFKKGPFRIAMAAGVPIVPIVFRNADEAGSKEAPFMQAATIDAVVLPPVPTRDWELADLDANIAAVRGLYLDTLANWPQR